MRTVRFKCEPCSASWSNVHVDDVGHVGECPQHPGLGLRTSEGFSCTPVRGEDGAVDVHGRVQRSIGVGVVPGGGDGW